MGKVRTPEKEAIYQAKQVARRQRILERNVRQEPIKKNLKAKGCSKQEIGNLFRSKCSEILLDHQDPFVVRFCYPGYPQHWIKINTEAQPFIDFVNAACKRSGVSKPLYSNNIGGYVLFLMKDEASAEFVRGLRLIDRATNTEMREPSQEEIEIFHAGWEERSPNMFSKYQKGGILRQPKPKKG